MLTRPFVQTAKLFYGLALPLLLANPAQGQSFCASDGQAQPVALHERFTSADCADCWAATPSVAHHRNALALDWIVPSPKGEDAPLSSAATRDALDRLEALLAQPPAPTHATSHTTPISTLTSSPSAGRSHPGLRVAHGLPFNNYVGTSIRYQPPGRMRSGELFVWQVLIETIPAGTEGTPVERNLVRNTLVRQWSYQSSLSKSKQPVWVDSRPMSIPEGAHPERLRVVGWVEDSAGRLLALAQSRCTAKKPPPPYPGTGGRRIEN